MDKRVFILLGILLIGIGSAEYNLPSERVINWSNVGVEGGIPKRNVEVDCTQAPYNVPIDGVSDCSSSINSCISGINENQVAYLPEGIYVVNSMISISENNKTLRGAGPNRTIIICNYHAFNENGCIHVAGSGNYQPSSSSTPSWDSGYTKGTTQVTLSSVSGLSVGDVLYLDVVNDGILVEDNISIFSNPTPDTMTRDEGTRDFAQAVIVKEIDGNNITIDPPLYHDFSSFNSPSSYSNINDIKYCGVEDLTVDGSLLGTHPKYLIVFSRGSNLWVKNIEGKLPVRSNVKIMYGSRIEIRDSYFHDAQSYASSSYGVETSSSSGILIENNIFDIMPAGVVIGPASSGNVVAYNYMNEIAYCGGGCTSPNWQTPAIGIHNPHASYNLIEGNEVPSVFTDNWFGSSSHNTIFRNRLPGRSLTKTMNTFPVALYTWSQYTNVVGNVLGLEGYHDIYEYKTNEKCGPHTSIYVTNYNGNCDNASYSNWYNNTFDTLIRHMNFDYVTDGVKLCDDAGEPDCHGSNPSETTIPYSLYLEEKPDWWCQESAWPPINPVGPSVSDIPAKRRYEGNVCTLSSQNEIQADNCSQEAVQQAIDSASDGDTVRVPAGECVWIKTLILNKSIILKGVGVDTTTILWTGGSGSVMRADSNGDLKIAISGFTISGNSDVYGITLNNLNTIQWFESFRVFNNTIKNCGRAVSLNGLIGGGVIDSNTFTGNNFPIAVHGPGNAGWNFPADEGGKNNPYIEGNIIDSSDITYKTIEGSYGGRFVFRFNNITGPSYYNDQIDAHGDTWYHTSCIQENQVRGTVNAEVYNNYFNLNGTTRLYLQRSGTGKIFNNYANIAISDVVMHIRDDDSRDSYGICYPVKTTWPGYDPNENTYFWNNTRPSGMIYLGRDDHTAQLVFEQLDYWADTQTNSQTPTTYFYKGLASNRDQFTCTAEDVYWETDTLKLYRCSSTNHWEFVYTPYIYPHPLTTAPFGTEICGEGSISSECWCEGSLRTEGTCEHGYYFTSSGCNHPAEQGTPDCIISLSELTAYINSWKINLDISINEVMDTIKKWKAGGY